MLDQRPAADRSGGFWSDEPSSRSDRARIRARIGGLHCSLCTGTIEKALGRLPGVDRVAVRLTHEQALVEYDPRIVRPQALLETMRDIGYTIHDPRKMRPFEEEERDLVDEGRRFLVATAMSLFALALIVQPAGAWSLVVPAVATLSLTGFVFLVPRARGIFAAGTASLTLGAGALVVLLLKEPSGLAPISPWIVAILALLLVFGIARHILRMAWQSLRRGILNQHVLFEAGAIAVLVGGAIGLIWQPPGYPTAPFFAVSVMISTYHIFSEWLSLIVKTRSSQAVKRLLDLQPSTARVVHDGQDRVTPVEAVRVGDLVRIRPGERVPVDGIVAEGHSTVDLSLVTGEPMPIERSLGDSIVTGSINGVGTLLVRVAAIGEESFLQCVARQVEDARALKPGILHLVDRVLRVYTPTVLATSMLAVATWGIVPLFLGLAPDLERAAFAGLRFVEGSVETIPIQDRSIDAVVVTWTL